MGRRVDKHANTGGFVELSRGLKLLGIGRRFCRTTRVQGSVENAS
jgi:hypothetical protein